MSLLGLKLSRVRRALREDVSKQTTTDLFEDLNDVFKRMKKLKDKYL